MLARVISNGMLAAIIGAGAAQAAWAGRLEVADVNGTIMLRFSTAARSNAHSFGE